ncbi:hypothetical protein GH714_010159 [Hevea brasiliensis]|uniref:Glutathione peroxidase n=1 Tax=Hevea brasiliensis TaxID=3981 RepID=A0A6A6MHT1_HEVBR|nr:hypothetical protein GH714_010159 [Hevea brasiliensis]
MPVDSIPAASTMIRSKVYHAPRLWYVLVNVIEAQDLVPSEKNRFPDVYVKVQIGNQVFKTKTCQARTFSAFWNEDLLFVAAEPFEDHLVLSVEDRVGPGKDEIIGRVIIPLSSVEKRADDRIIHSRWFNLEKPVAVDVDQLKKEKFSSRIHLRACLDGGYHVLDESTNYSSDLRPTAKQLWRPPIGLLELGILNAVGLHPMKTRDGRGTSDTYCVANQLGEKGSNGKDLKIGKVRIRISTLETGRVYTHSYPLLVLHPTGVKKMGELHLAIRFTCTSFVNMLYQYSRPLLPKMHYVRPFTVMQLDMLRHQAVNIVALRLGRQNLHFERRSMELSYRPRYPPHMNTKISQAETVHPDELDEEFDTFPTSRSPELVRMRGGISGKGIMWNFSKFLVDKDDNVVDRYAPSTTPLSIEDANGNDVDLSIFKGKVLLIVNVASKCGMTNSNYTELNQLYEKYKDQGLEILAFPCNQFGEEEPGSNDEIQEFVCTRFKSEFPIFGKVEVNGENASLLYKFLKSGKWGIFGDDIQWNFAKFLVNKDGQVVDRYYPTTSPLSLEVKGQPTFEAWLDFV